MGQFNSETSEIITWQRVFNIIGGVWFLIAFFLLLMVFVGMSNHDGSSGLFLMCTVIGVVNGIIFLFLASVIEFLLISITR